MGAQFEQITYSSELSLTLIVDDIARRRRESKAASSGEPMDVGNWLNALQHQSAPLVHSRASREHLEAWLAEVENQFDGPAETPLAGLLAP
jgi:hypothetical protein